MSDHGFIRAEDIGLTPKKLADLFRDTPDEEDDRSAEDELYDRHRAQEEQARAWAGVSGDVAWCNASPDGRHIGAPCLGCTATPPGWIA